mmetsp:Transcript_9803/g.15520  ORF Transcript_9803/g.15520 Transcript_9803/m.15520 type:complete len:89 (+) Transcript_9803:104-370(+)
MCAYNASMHVCVCVRMHARVNSVCMYACACVYVVTCSLYVCARVPCTTCQRKALRYGQCAMQVNLALIFQERERLRASERFTRHPSPS